MISGESLQLVGLGVVAGVLGGALGLGGGFILVPVFHTVFGWTLIQSVAVSQFCILASSMSATHLYVKRGQVDLRLGVMIGSTTILGAAIGATVASRIPGTVVLFLFTAVTLFAGIRMWGGVSENDGVPNVRTPKRLGIAVSLSGLIGAMAAILGVGGGVVQVPIIHAYLGEPIRRATATSAYIIGLTASTSAAIYYHRGDLVLDKAVLVALGVLAGAFMGAASQRHISATSLRRSLSVVLFAVTIRMGMKVIGW